MSTKNAYARMCMYGEQCPTKKTCSRQHACAFGDRCHVRECIYIHENGINRHGLHTKYINKQVHKGYTGLGYGNRGVGYGI